MEEKPDLKPAPLLAHKRGISVDDEEFKNAKRLRDVAAHFIAHGFTSVECAEWCMANKLNVNILSMIAGDRDRVGERMRLAYAVASGTPKDIEVILAAAPRAERLREAAFRYREVASVLDQAAREVEATALAMTAAGLLPMPFTQPAPKNTEEI